MNYPTKDINSDTHSSPPQLQSSMAITIDLSELSDRDAEGEYDDEYFSEIFGSNVSDRTAER
jgi:hypothetical protein